MISRGAWVVPALLLLAGCGSGKDAQKRTQRTPQVGYVVVQTGSVPVTTELSGRTSAYATSEVRPQINGIILRRMFVEGGLVRKGQTLYQIDPSLYRANVNQAQANLASAQANAETAQAKADRYTPLAKIQAVSQQDLSDAVAQARQGKASIAQNAAALRTAQINLHYTRVPAPISGRIGRSLYTQGALVTASQTDPLAVIQQLDPMYVDIQQSSSDLLALRQRLANGGSVPGSADVRLKLEDGSDYPIVGRVEFSEVTVDASTGTVTLRALFPNPNGLLLPGMFVRAILAPSVDPKAILVPQVALNRDPRGNATVLVLGAGNKVELRKVTADRTVGSDWVVTSGLSAGEKVISEGTANARPGQVVKPVPAGTPEHLSAGSGKHGAGGANGS